MRPHLFILPACVLALAAQDPWEVIPRPSTDHSLETFPSWVLIRQQGVGRSALASEALFPARVATDFRYIVVPESAFQGLARKLGLTQMPRWALLDPTGQVCLQGVAEPSGKALREAMEGRGWIPRWERRQAFLKAHPGHGDATLDALDELEGRFLHTSRVADTQLQGPAAGAPGKPGEAIDSRLAQVLASPFGQAEAVRPFQQVLAWFQELPPEDPECTKAWHGVFALELGGATTQEPIVEGLQNLLKGLEANLRRDPVNVGLWRAWAGLAMVLPGVDAEGLVAGLEAAPGTPWPIPTVASVLTWRKLPQERLERAELELAAPGDARARLRAWAPKKLEALLALKRDEEARLWILEARRRDPAAFGSLSTDHVVDENHPARALLKEAFDQEFPSTGSDSAGLALVLLGRPSWVTAFEALDRHPALDPWGRGWLMGPGELTLLHLVGSEEREIRTILNLPPGPRWVLVRDSGECFAQGVEAPDPIELAQTLRSAAPPLLDRLEAFLRIHPDHRQAQQNLVEVLTARMPHPRLELKLAQACAKAGEAPILRNGEFKPQIPIWEPLARKAAPAAEARLGRWPESLEAWMAWMDWQSLLPKPASPTERQRGLAVWKTRSRSGPGPLPLDVTTAVARRLEQAGRWKDLAEWGLFQWEGGWRKAIGWNATGPAGETAENREARERDHKDLLTLAQLTRRALFTLGRKADLQRFREDWQMLNPTHGADQGRVNP